MSFFKTVITETKDKLVMCQVLVNFCCVLTHAEFEFDLSQVCVDGFVCFLLEVPKGVSLVENMFPRGAVLLKGFDNFVKLFVVAICVPL